MSQPIEVDDQEATPTGHDHTPGDQGITRTPSEPEHHSGSEESKYATSPQLSYIATIMLIVPETLPGL